MQSVAIGYVSPLMLQGDVSKLSSLTVEVVRGQESMS